MKKFSAILACLGFWGVMIHPAMLVALILGVIGLNKCEHKTTTR